jgi:arylsulfatase A
MANTGSHVPLIANWPGVTPAGRTCDDLINFTDFLPTLAATASAKAPADRPIDGQSFLPQIKGDKGQPRQWSLIELNERRFILGGKYRLQNNGNLFDLTDPLDEKPIPPEKQTDQDAAARNKLTAILANLPKGNKELPTAAE